MGRPDRIISGLWQVRVFLNEIDLATGRASHVDSELQRVVPAFVAVALDVLEPTVVHGGLE